MQYKNNRIVLKILLQGSFFSNKAGRLKYQLIYSNTPRLRFIFCNLRFLILVVQVTAVSFKIDRRKHVTSENNSWSYLNTTTLRLN